jgi:hypothetical protein
VLQTRGGIKCLKALLADQLEIRNVHAQQIRAVGIQFLKALLQRQQRLAEDNQAGAVVLAPLVAVHVRG